MKNIKQINQSNMMCNRDNRFQLNVDMKLIELEETIDIPYRVKTQSVLQIKVKRRFLFVWLNEECWWSEVTKDRSFVQIDTINRIQISLPDILTSIRRCRKYEIDFIRERLKIEQKSRKRREKVLYCFNQSEKNKWQSQWSN